MRIKNMTAGLLALTLFSGTIVAPLAAEAQRGQDRDHREQRDRDNRERRDRDRDNRDRQDRDRDRRDRDDNRDRDRQDRDSRNWRERESDRRQQTKNEWRNIAIGSGALGVLGLLQRDNTLMFAGAAGALYSLNRYEQDRKSQSRLDRARSEYFSRPYFYRNGQRFERRTVNRNGQRYYQFFRR